MKTNKKGIDLIKRFEGCKLSLYRDPAGKFTIGWGHLVLKDEHFNTITKEQAEKLFRKDLFKHEKIVEKYVKVKLNQNQFSALVSWVFNFGETNFRTSGLLEAINYSDFLNVPRHLIRWIHIRKDGKLVKSKGLIRRRLAEATLFIS